MKERKQIVFIENYSNVMTYKIAREFKKKGYETVLIRMFEPNKTEKNFYNDAYNKIISLDLSFIKNLTKFKILSAILKKHIFLSLKYKELRKLKPYVIFGRANPNIMVALFRIYFRKTPFIYFPYDLHVHWVPTIELARRTRNLSILEIISEKFCFEHSDGIMHKGAPDELNHINGRILGKNVKLPKFIINFHPYCSREFIVNINKNKLSKKDKEIHIVFVGTEGKASKENYFSRLSEFKDIIKQKIHVHLYLGLNIESNENSSIKSFFNEYKDFPDIGYFHLHKSLDPKKLIKEISKYDFGAGPQGGQYYEFDLDPKFCTGNKIATYLEAGIPAIYRKEVIFINKILKDYNLGLIWPEKIKDSKSFLKNQNLKKLQKNLLKMREDFLIEKQFPRLEEFIEMIVENKN